MVLHAATTCLFVMKRLGATKKPVPENVVSSGAVCASATALACSRAQFTTALMAFVLSFMSREANDLFFSLKIPNVFASAILFMNSIDTSFEYNASSSPGTTKNVSCQVLVVTNLNVCCFFFFIQLFQAGLEIRMNQGLASAVCNRTIERSVWPNKAVA